MSNLDFNGAVAEMTEAVSYLKSTGSKKVGRASWRARRLEG
jgi:hypothetical protein